MKKIRQAMPFLVSVFLIAASCGGKPKTDPAVQRDYAKYMAQLVQILPIEERALEANTRATNAEGANDAKYAKALGETIIPTFEEFAAELARMRPLTEPVQELHRIYLRRTILVISGFKELEKSTRTGDRALVESFRDKDAEGKALFDAWGKKLGELDKLYGTKKKG